MQSQEERRNQPALRSSSADATLTWLCCLGVIVFVLGNLGTAQSQNPCLRTFPSSSCTPPYGSLMRMPSKAHIRERLVWNCLERIVCLSVCLSTHPPLWDGTSVSISPPPYLPTCLLVSVAGSEHPSTWLSSYLFPLGDRQSLFILQCLLTSSLQGFSYLILQSARTAGLDFSTTGPGMSPRSQEPTAERYTIQFFNCTVSQKQRKIPLDTRCEELLYFLSSGQQHTPWLTFSWHFRDEGLFILLYHWKEDSK